MWDARIIERIPELGAEPDDIVIVRPEHEYPVLVVHRHGPEALTLVEKHRRLMWSRQSDAGECPTPEAREVAS